MEKLDKVETVRQKTGVSYEEARNALEQCNYDVLDAIVFLERQGKTQTHTAHHTTSANQHTISTEMVAAQQEYEQSSKKTRANEVLDRIVDVLKRLCNRGLEVSFVVDHNNERVLTLPVLILAILILFLFPATVPLLIVGLFFGFRYRFEGLQTSSVDINGAMDKVANQAESLKNNVMGNQS